MCQVVLCDGLFDGISIYRVAYLKEGELHIDGQDLGASVAEFWGESEYEYFYLFSREMTSDLYNCLKKNLNSSESLLQLVVRFFLDNRGIENFVIFVRPIKLTMISIIISDKFKKLMSGYFLICNIADDLRLGRTIFDGRDAGNQ